MTGPSPRALLCFVFLVICVTCFAQNLAPKAASANNPDSVLLARIADEYWKHQLETTAFYQLQRGATINDLPDLSSRRAKEASAFARRVLHELKAVHPERLQHQEWLTLEVLRWRALQDSQWEKYQ